jgi:hypothetical protein
VVIAEACFIARDSTGQALAYVYFEDDPSSAFGGQAAHQGRGAADGGELRQAAGAGAPKWLKLPTNCRDVTAQHVGADQRPPSET